VQRCVLPRERESACVRAKTCKAAEGESETRRSWPKKIKKTGRRDGKEGREGEREGKGAVQGRGWHLRWGKRRPSSGQ